MKKKLVAFAVTAAMVITSAVPVFAATPDFQEKDSWVNGNIINIPAGETPASDDMAADLTVEGAKATFDMVVDLNVKRIQSNGDGFVIIPEFTGGAGDANDAIPTGLPVLSATINGSTGLATLKLVANGTGAELGDVTANATGLAKLTWEITAKEVKVTVTDYSQKDGVDTVMTATIPATAYVKNLTDVKIVNLDGRGLKNSLRLYTERPADLSAVQMGRLDTDTQKYVDITEDTELVVDDRIKITSVSFGADTVFEGSEISNYVTVKWYADGTEITTNADKLDFTVTDAYKGKKITAVVKGLTDKAGMYGQYTWGADNSVVALATRLSGANRYETAMAVADQMLKEKDATKFDGVVIAYGDDYADALAGTPYVNYLNSNGKIVPLLLVNENAEDAVYDYIVKNVKQEATVHILGGEGVVSKAFADRLDRYYKVERLAGADRFATNVEILKAMATVTGTGVDEDIDMNNWNRIFVCSGYDYADALSAAAAGQPILLVGDELTADQVKFLNHVGDGVKKEFVIVGGTAAVSKDIAGALEEYTGTKHHVAESVIRVGGENRYETNEAFIKAIFGNKVSGKEAVVIASGNDFPDGLTGGVFALTAKSKTSPLILVNEYNTDRAEGIIDAATAAELYVIGGTGAVSNATLQKIA